MKTTAEIIIQPQGKRLKTYGKKSLFIHLVEAGIPIQQACGGQGTCGKCRVQMTGAPAVPVSGLDTKFLSKKEIAEGLRLACGVTPRDGDIFELTLPTHGPAVKPQLEKEVFPTDPWPGTGASDGVMAIDFGTTTVSGHLLDPFTGRVLCSADTGNHQDGFGADVVSRLAYASHGGKAARRRLKSLAMESLEEVSAALTKGNKKIRHIVAVMNTAMESLILNWDPDGIGRSPVQPETDEAVHFQFQLKSRTSGLNNVWMHLPAIIGGFVGSDTVAALLAAGQLNCRPPYLLVDIGTNAEVALVTASGISACSTAAGPAFEGGGIRFGMRAVDGAVSRVAVEPDRLYIEVMGNDEAKGIAGSGLISLVGGLLRINALDRFGVICPERLPRGRFGTGDHGHCIRLAREVSVSEDDIQQLILAKASVRAGAEVLLMKTGVSSDDLNHVVLCGTFSKGLKTKDILATGLIPAVAPGKIIIRGSAAAEGACMMACSQEAFEKANMLAAKTDHIRLSGDSDFNQIYQHNIGFV